MATKEKRKIRLLNYGINSQTVCQLKREQHHPNHFKNREYISLNRIKLDINNILPFVRETEIHNLQTYINQAHALLHEKTGPGKDYLGWVNLPSTITKTTIKKIQDTADALAADSDVFVCCGIGGSYLGAKATIDALIHPYYNSLYPDQRGHRPQIAFAGHHLDADELRGLLDFVDRKRLSINVISKSGTTTETAIAFRILRDLMLKSYGPEETSKLIVATTDRSKGALREMARKNNYKSFTIPDDIGGRFSIFTPVGLLPIAVSGIDIAELIAGAQYMEKITSHTNVFENPAYLYAAIRTILNRQGYNTEVLSSGMATLRNVAEWWKQLFGESEGKDGKGIFPASLCLTTDLHSLGQYLQDGRRNIFETFLNVEKTSNVMIIPEDPQDLDDLNYISGRDLQYVNEQAMLGTAHAHLQGGVPNMTIQMHKLNAFSLGQLYYFFEKAVAISGYLLGVNPFDQPGVEDYKKAMFTLLEKPEYRKESHSLKEKIKKDPKFII